MPELVATSIGACTVSIGNPRGGNGLAILSDPETLGQFCQMKGYQEVRSWETTCVAAGGLYDQFRSGGSWMQVVAPTPADCAFDHYVTSTVCQRPDQ
jgi:hypothetical protein